MLSCNKVNSKPTKRPERFRHKRSIPTPRWLDLLQFPKTWNYSAIQPPRPPVNVFILLFLNLMRYVSFDSATRFQCFYLVIYQLVYYLSCSLDLCLQHNFTATNKTQINSDSLLPKYSPYGNTILAALF